MKNLEIEITTDPRQIMFDPKLSMLYNIMLNAKIPESIKHGDIWVQGRIPLVTLDLSFIIPEGKHTFEIVGHVISEKLPSINHENRNPNK